jgi:hypothetical protein
MIGEMLKQGLSRIALAFAVVGFAGFILFHFGAPSWIRAAACLCIVAAVAAQAIHSDD